MNLFLKLIIIYRISIIKGSHFLYETENKLHKPSCTEIYYQTGLQSTEANMLLELFSQIISEPCFTVLRTDEQLGYIVWSGLRRTNGTQGLRLIVQSDKHPQYVEERMDLFMKSMQVCERKKNYLILPFRAKTKIFHPFFQPGSYQKYDGGTIQQAQGITSR